MTTTRTKSPIGRVIELAGSKTKLANLLGISVSAITNALRRGRLPADQAIAIEFLFGGQVKATELRPDLDPRG